MAIQVEVCVQDCFTPLEPTEPAFDATVHLERWHDWFQRWLEELEPNLSPIEAYELSLRLTDDREMQALNAQYRQQDKPTDVLAFAALETDYPLVDEQVSLPLYLGDIVISIDTAQQQAQAQNHSLETELAWLASHGLLHLLGWDHPDEEHLVQMLTQQKALLHTVGLLIADG